MRNKYSFAIMLALLVISLKTVAQTKNIIPASPEAGALAKFVNYPISYNTGVPNINIPLYELKAGELSLPVNLSYHAGGFKVNEQAGNVGLGWSLSTDLQIAVKINGLSDLIGVDGYIHNGILNLYGGYGTSDFMRQFNTYETCHDLILNKKDLQPDEFYYKLLNKAGKFYFKSNGTIETVPYNGIKIEFVSLPNSTCEFKITDTDGTVYIFGDGLSFENSKAVELAQTATPVVSSWKCTSITSPSKADTIAFKYKIGEAKYVFNFPNSIEILSAEIKEFGPVYGDLKRPGDFGLNFGRYWQGLNSVKDGVPLVPLFTIACPKYLCVGGSDAGLNLLTNQPYGWVNYPVDNQYKNLLWRKTQTIKLDTISYSGVKGNAITLSYNYQANLSNQLSSINISDGMTNQAINFMQSFEQSAFSQDVTESNQTYYLDTVKASNNDKYGFNYYNKVVFDNHSTGSDAWGGVNQLTVNGLNNSTTIQSLPYAEFQSNNYGIPTTSWIGTFANSVEVDSNKIRNGILVSITNPAGGQTCFEYGPNEYYDIDRQTKKIAGGMRINRIKYYNNFSSGGPASEKIYKYGENESGNGFIKNQFRQNSNAILEGYFYTQTRKYLQFNEIDNKSYGVVQNELKTTLLPGSLIDMFYSGGAPIYYTEVAEYKEENGYSSGKTVYNYDSLANMYYSNSFYPGTNITKRNDYWDQGHLKSETNFKKSSNGFDIIKSKTYDYFKYIKTQIPVIEIFQNTEYWDTNNINLLPEHGYNEGPDAVQTYITNTDFTIIDYELPVGDMLLNKEVEKTKDGLNEIIKTTNYFYDDLLPNGMAYPTQLTRTETLLSNGKNQATYFSYPQNYAAGTSFIDDLKNNYMQTSLIEKITTLDGKVIEGKLNTYLPDNTGHIAKTFELDPKLPLSLSNFNSIKNTRSASYIQDPNYFETFSLTYANKRLAMVTPKDNVSTSYIWSYNNQYPIAKIVNATSNECGSTGFENNETNSFSTPDYAVTEFVIDAFTGRKALKVSSLYGPGSIFQVGDNAPKHTGYKASVWVKGSKAAYLHFEVDGLWSVSMRAKNNGEGDGWHLLEVELTRKKIEPYFDPTLKIRVYIGIEDGGVATFDDFRFYPLDAQMTTNTYDPLIGMTSASDVNNRPTTYQYDVFGRLSLVRDFLGNILKKYDYHYKQ